MEDWNEFYLANEPLKAHKILPGDYIHLEENQVENIKQYLNVEKISDTAYRNYLVIDVLK